MTLANEGLCFLLGKAACLLCNYFSTDSPPVVGRLVRTAALPCTRQVCCWPETCSLSCQYGLLQCVLAVLSMHNRLDVVRCLLNSASVAVADTDAVDSCGSTPFLDAIRFGHVEVAKLLHSRGVGWLSLEFCDCGWQGTPRCFSQIYTFVCSLIRTFLSVCRDCYLFRIDANATC